ncbi:MAG TPA: PIN domain-containing protein [Gaiellaceae bacterium]|nr:PIN domain-containing protein [Gaiellaceae bacterium]
MTAVLLDTSILIEPPSGPRPDDEVGAISVISLGELEVGVLVARSVDERASRLERLERVRRTFDPLPVDENVIRAYARAVAASRESGRNPRVLDTLIAATAMANGLELLTRDIEQARLPGIQATTLGSGK